MQRKMITFDCNSSPFLGSAKDLNIMNHVSVQLTGRGYREGRLLLELKHHLVMKWREG